MRRRLGGNPSCMWKTCGHGQFVRARQGRSPRNSINRPLIQKAAKLHMGNKFGTQGELQRGISTVPRGLCARVRKGVLGAGCWLFVFVVELCMRCVLLVVVFCCGCLVCCWCVCVCFVLLVAFCCCISKVRGGARARKVLPRWVPTRRMGHTQITPPELGELPG
jgi:hypothetical protein